MRKPFIAGNWKMNKTITESVAFINDLKPLVAATSDVDIAVCPTFLSLSSTVQACVGSNIQIGGQNLFGEDSGAYTGEVSAVMLKDAGARWVIIGHSERRQYFGETNETVNKKVKSALANNLAVILCVGETLQERENDDTFSVIKAQLAGGLAGVKGADLAAKLVVAYEPVWAIGTGQTATPEQAQAVHSFIRAQLRELLDDELATQIRLQYGGSVKPSNVKELMAQADIDGALVGGASLEAQSFAQLIRFKS